MGLENLKVFKDMKDTPLVKDLIGKCGGNLDNLTKVLILSVASANKEKAEVYKKDYLDNVIKKSVRESLKGKSKEEVKNILQFEELNTEVQQARKEEIKKILESL